VLAKILGRNPKIKSLHLTQSPSLPTSAHVGMTYQRTIVPVVRDQTPCSVGGQCTRSATRSQALGVQESATTNTLSQEKAFHALPIQMTKGVPGAPRLDSNVQLTNGLAPIQKMVADARFKTIRNTAKVSKEIADTFLELVPLIDVSRLNR